jgi:hypothetical protein
MMSWLKRLAAPVAAVALFGLLSVAEVKADTISTTSTGTFTAAGTDVASGSTIKTASGNTVLTYVGAADFSLDLEKVITLGEFTLTSSITSGTGEKFSNNDDFNLTITQVVTPPGTVGSGTSVGDFKAIGTIKVGSGGEQIVNFQPGTVLIGGKSYELIDVTISGPTPLGPGHGLLQATLTNPTAVPLPAVAWVGLSLLGGLGGARGLKRFRRGGELAVA